jgi:uncharacterized protein (TIGR02996 family)
MSEDEAFLQAIVAAPQEDDLRLVDADWLEDRGDLRGEYLRVAVTLARLERGRSAGDTQPRQGRGEIVRLKTRLAELQFGVSRDWLEKVHRGPILYCNRIPEPGSVAQCPGQWERLQRVNLPLTRQCGVCLRTVLLCRTGREVQTALRLGMPLVMTAGGELA